MNTHAAAPAAQGTAPARWLAASAALLVALPLLWGAGFASADALHDTAHDVRHAMGLPCH
jgi:cobalt transporter subunit CbtB